MTELFDQKSLQPLYIQVADELKREIDKGIYPAGSKLPSENQLVELLKVSRVTVRKALQQLNDLGYTFSEKGKGTFVKSNKLRHDFLSMSGFAQEAAGSGLEAKNIVDAFEVVPADELVAEKLNIAQGEPVNFARRLRLINDQVVSYEEFYIPRVLLPNLTQQDLEGSKFEYLSRHGIEMVKTQQKLIPALPDDAAQKLLAVDKLDPILINQSQNFYEEQRVYEYSIVYYKSSLYDFEITARV
ncbi:GntR family transcriptional regulator [Vibrio owensii]|uniref:GntR family transcriptional regulator n=1 Tax=Vibrio owensii TaxID=696485 RepID=UPI000996F490|nr:GntR family transcriptional regulator [Vibrio owensii]AQW61123.1 GntR family transcriptional regulator [Vibrio owensii]HDM8223349.1 GntR family transcriptional regulator [Vibrio campbellii]HDM8243450.1 GntR family transcriptional regulator [Vibrio campbellii]